MADHGQSQDGAEPPPPPAAEHGLAGPPITGLVDATGVAKPSDLPTKDPHTVLTYNTLSGAPGGSAPPQEPTRFLEQLVIESHTSQLIKPGVCRVYSNTAAFSYFMNNQPRFHTLETVWLISLRASTPAAARSFGRGPMDMRAPFQTSELADKSLTAVAAKFSNMAASCRMTELNGVAHQLGKMLALVTIGKEREYTLSVAFSRTNPSECIEQLGSVVTPFDSTNAKVYLPRCLGTSYGANTFWVVVAAILSAGGHVVSDCMEVTSSDTDWRGCYPDLRGAAFTSAILEATKYIIGQGQEAGDASGLLVAFVAGLHTLLSVQGHSDEGGLVRDVLRCASFLPPYGVTTAEPTTITALPVCSPSGPAETSRSSVDVLLLTTAAMVAVADPGCKLDGRVFPTVLGTNEELEDDYGVLMGDTELESLLRQLSKSSNAFCKEYTDVLCSAFGVLGRDCGELILRNLFARFVTKCNQDGNARHLRAGSCAPFYWVEPTGLLPLCLSEGRACAAWRGGPIGDRCSDRVIKLVEEKKSITCVQNIVNLNVDFTWTNTRSNLLFALLDDFAPEVNSHVIIRSLDTNNVIYEGDRGDSCLPLATRMQKGLTMYDILWKRGESPYPHPAEFLNISVRPLGVEIDQVYYDEGQTKMTGWPTRSVFDSEKYEATITVPGLRGLPNRQRKEVTRQCYRRPSWVSMTVGEAGAAWSTDVRLYSNRRPLDTGSGPSYITAAYDSLGALKMSAGNRKALATLHERLEQEASAFDGPQRAPNYYIPEEVDLSEIADVVYKLDEMRSKKIELDKLIEGDPELIGDGIALIGRLTSNMAACEKYLDACDPAHVAACRNQPQKKKQAGTNSAANLPSNSFVVKVNKGILQARPAAAIKKGPGARDRYSSHKPPHGRSSHLRGTDTTAPGKQTSSSSGGEDDSDGGSGGRSVVSDRSAPAKSQPPPVNRATKPHPPPKLPPAAPVHIGAVSHVPPIHTAPDLNTAQRRAHRSRLPGSSNKPYVSHSAREAVARFVNRPGFSVPRGGVIPKPPPPLFPDYPVVPKIPSILDMDLSDIERSVANLHVKVPCPTGQLISFDDPKPVDPTSPVVSSHHTSIHSTISSTPPTPSGIQIGDGGSQRSPTISNSTGGRMSDPVYALPKLSQPAGSNYDPGSLKIHMDRVPVIPLAPAAPPRSTSMVSYATGRINDSKQVLNLSQHNAWRYILTRLESLERGRAARCTRDSRVLDARNWVRAASVFCLGPHKRYVASVIQVIEASLEIISVHVASVPLKVHAHEMAVRFFEWLVARCERADGYTELYDVAIIYMEILARTETYGDLIDLLGHFIELGLTSDADTTLVTWVGDLPDEYYYMNIWPEDRPPPTQAIITPVLLEELIALVSRGPTAWLDVFKSEDIVNMRPLVNPDSTSRLQRVPPVVRDHSQSVGDESFDHSRAPRSRTSSRYDDVADDDAASSYSNATPKRRGGRGAHQ